MPLADKLTKWWDNVGDGMGDNILDALGGSVAKGFFVIPSYKVGAGVGLTEKEKLTTIKTEDELDKMTAEMQKDMMQKAKRLLDSDDPLVLTTKQSTGFKAKDSTSKDFFTYEVQYNPSSINLHSMSGPRRDKSYGAQGETTFNTVAIPTFTELSVTLIFEAINTSDAFISSTDTPVSVTGDSIINGGVNLANKGSQILGMDPNSKKAPYSVKNNVQGFLSLMTRTGWRNITFYYGMTCFHGYLLSVRPEYKMFNKAGEPILAEVALTIRQDISRELDNKIWQDSFLNMVKYQN